MKLDDYQVRIYDASCKVMHYVIIGESAGMLSFDLGCFSTDSKLDLCSFMIDYNRHTIYENDIVSCGNELYQVVYEKGMFWIKNSKHSLIMAQAMHYEAIKVLGNIHENPDLLLDLQKEE